MSCPVVVHGSWVTGTFHLFQDFSCNLHTTRLLWTSCNNTCRMLTQSDYYKFKNKSEVTGENTPDKTPWQLNDKFCGLYQSVLRFAWRLLLCTLSTVGHSSLGHNISHSVSLTYVKRARVQAASYVATRCSLRKETAHQLYSHVCHNTHDLSLANITEVLPWLHTSGNHNQKVIYNQFKGSEMSFVTVIWWRWTECNCHSLFLSAWDTHLK